MSVSRIARPALTLLAALTVATVVAAMGAGAAAAAPHIAVTWKSPPRMANLDVTPTSRGYHRSDASPAAANYCCSVRSTQIDPKSWPVKVDACETRPSRNQLIGRFRFEADAEILGSGCERTLYFDHQGEHEVTVTATDSSGASSTKSLTVRSKDFLVASIGDSYASGEGVPPYADHRCDRSAQASPAIAARDLEMASPASVTFIHLACSGAKIEGWPGEAAGHGGLIEGYLGANKVGDEELRPQLNELHDLIKRRPLDALVVSIGGNDIGFSKLIEGCLGGRECYVEGSESRRIFDDAIKRLPGLFDDLHAAVGKELGDAVDPRRVYLTGYPDPTMDAQGEYCTALFGGLTIRQNAYRWASETILAELTRVMREKAGEFGWQFVAPSDDFRTHGYCATDPWFTSLSTSLIQQFDTLGVFHPNAAGHRSLGASLFAAMRSDLLPGGERS